MAASLGRMHFPRGAVPAFVAGAASVVLLASVTAGAPAANAQSTVAGDQAQAAIAAALAQANATGMTFILNEDAAPMQRNAAGTVAVSVEEGVVRSMTLRESGKVSLVGTLLEPAQDPSVRRQVYRAYGIGKDPFVILDGSVEDAAQFDHYFDPFTAAAAIPTAMVTVDDRGRATEIRVSDELALKVLSWTAPLAVRPPANRLPDLDTYFTVLRLEDTSSLMMYVGGLAKQATATPGYRGAPLATLRRAVRVGGWQASNTSRGVKMTVTDGLGATWSVSLVAGQPSVRVSSPVLLRHPPVRPTAEVAARATLGSSAMLSTEWLACPLKCQVNGIPQPFTYQDTEPRLVSIFRSFGITGLTPGPDYPENSDALTSIGLTGSSAAFTAGFAQSTEGLCLAVPLKGPGIMSRPVSFEPIAGTVGPNGTCVSR